jgi:hypothetical protein
MPLLDPQSVAPLSALGSFVSGAATSGRRQASLPRWSAAYHRYRPSDRAARDYDGFPTILVVTQGPGAEERMADAVMATDVGQVSRLDVLLTTVELLTRRGGGAFGKIWRSSSSDARQSWLASQPLAKKTGGS